MILNTEEYKSIVSSYKKIEHVLKSDDFHEYLRSKNCRVDKESSNALANELEKYLYSLGDKINPYLDDWES